MLLKKTGIFFALLFIPPIFVFLCSFRLSSLADMLGGENSDYRHLAVPERPAYFEVECLVVFAMS